MNPAWPSISAVEEGRASKKRRIIFSSAAARMLWGVAENAFPLRDETPPKMVEWVLTEDGKVICLPEVIGRPGITSNVSRFEQVLPTSFSLARTANIEVWWRIKDISEGRDRLWLDPDNSCSLMLTFVPLSALPEESQKVILRGAPMTARLGETNAK